MIENFGEAALCTVGEILQFAEINNLIITPIAEFNKTIIVVFCLGAVAGVIVWEIFKYMRAYGKLKANSEKPE